MSMCYFALVSHFADKHYSNQPYLRFGVVAAHFFLDGGQVVGCAASEVIIQRIYVVFIYHVFHIVAYVNLVARVDYRLNHV